MSKHKGGYLSLDGLTELSDSAASSLSKHKGGLSIKGLTQAELLPYLRAASKHKEGLSIDGLTQLSDSAASSLSKHKGGLSIDGLTQLSDSAAESLSKYEGDHSYSRWLDPAERLGGGEFVEDIGYLQLGDSLEELEDSSAIKAFFHRLMNYKPRDDEEEVTIALSRLEVIPHSIVKILSKSKKSSFQEF